MTTLACGMALLAWAVAAYPATPAKAAIADIVQTAIGPWIEKEKPPGVIVVVRHDGRTQFFPFGQANKALNQAVTADTIFELASITKVFTTTSLAMEVRAGKMRLDDRVEQYLPYLRQNGGDIKKVGSCNWQRTHRACRGRRASRLPIVTGTRSRCCVGWPNGMRPIRRAASRCIPISASDCWDWPLKSTISSR